jgi:hypothetical protein
VEIAVVVLDRRLERDYWQECNAGRRKQEGLGSNIIHHIHFIDWQRSVKEECMECLSTDKYINICVFRSHFNRCTTSSVMETYCLTIL